MTKREFLDGLRNALTGEVPEAEIENNLRFYDDYISSRDNSGQDEAVINQLGDPRLIAKTIIETYQLSHGPLYNNARHHNAYEDADTRTYDTNGGNDNETYTKKEYRSHSDSHGKGFNFQLNSSLTWYQKLLLSLILLLVIVVVVIVGGVLIQVFFSIGIPLLIIYFGYRLIVNNRRY